MNFLKLKSDYIYILFLLSVSILFTLNTDLIDITIMEARNYITAKEIQLENNWLKPTLNGYPRYEKPPLPTWLSAIVSNLLDSKSLYIYRLPGFIFLAIISITTFYFSKKISNKREVKYITSFVCITSFYVIGIIIEAPWDIFSHSFMLIAIYFLYDLFTNDNYNNYKSVLVCLFISLSVLSKGPISIYTMLIPFIISIYLVYKNITSKKSLQILLLIIIGTLSGSSWYLYLLFEDSENLKLITSKETANWTSYNVRPFYYYWNFIIQSGIWLVFAGIGLIYPYFKKRINNVNYKLFFIWTISSVLLLSIVPEKKPRYLMPVLIPLSFIISFVIDYCLINYQKIKYKFLLKFHYYLIMLIGVSFLTVKHIIKDKDINIIDILIFSAIVIQLVGIFKKHQNKSIYISAILLILIITNTPTLLETKNKNYNAIKNENNYDFKVYSNYKISPEIIWNFGDKLEQFEISKIKHNDEQFGVFTEEKQLNSLIINNKEYKIKTFERFDLNRNGNKKRLITFLTIYKFE